MIPLKTETRSLPCRLTPDEFIARAETHARVAGQIEDTEAQHAKVKAEQKAELVALEAQASRLAAVIRTREEQRTVKVQSFLDPALHRVTVIRTDTGEELEHRPATVEEMQRHLPLESAAS